MYAFQRAQGVSQVKWLQFGKNSNKLVFINTYSRKPEIIFKTLYILPIISPNNKQTTY